ncbi:MAG: redoxin domain-containing protein [Nitrospirota bacterium]|nr:redoxin domain-containing protein [Nitrospirota bacterium]MDH5585009.1 redoxin domain-containing protein [Nitrospirota bacterium]MDH5773681.1 redoxin domain-containing protein [Nitrospirota bacterium]
MRIFLGVVFFGIIGALLYFVPLSFAKGGQAPEIISPTWINSKPLRMEELRGKVVMVEFWTFGCWNCRKIEPYVKGWHQKYADKGLVVIAVHSPEFSHEKDVENVKAYVKKNGISYAVPIDNDFLNWRRYQNRYWPTLYVIDKNGTIQYTRIGEGAYEQTEEAIQRLLLEPA